MSERLFNYDPATGLRTWFSTDNDGDTWRFRHEQDVTPILDQNKESQADGFDKRADMWHAARIPTVVLMEWMTKFGVKAWRKDHADGVRKLLNHPDYRYLRVNHFIM